MSMQALDLGFADTPSVDLESLDRPLNSNIIGGDLSTQAEDEEELVHQIAAASSCNIIHLFSNYSPEKSLELIAQALKLNAENECLWFARCHFVNRVDGAFHVEVNNIMSLGIDMRSQLLCELSHVKRILSSDINNRCAWNYMCCLSFCFEIDTAREEIDFVKEILSHNKELEYPWKYFTILARSLKADSISDAIEFVNKILFDNGENHFAWFYRWHIARMKLVHLDEELKFTHDILIEQPKNYYAWHYRQWFKKDRQVSLQQERVFTETILSKDAKNVYAWYHRKWLWDAFGGWEAELGFSANFLEQDIDNEYAWKQRSLAVMRLGLGDVSNPDRNCEVRYAKTAIRKNPESTWAWLHLQNLYSSDFDDINVETILEDVLLRGISGDLRKDITKNRRTYINVLETLHYFVSNGYKSSHNMDVVIKGLCSRYKLGFGMTSSSSTSIVSGFLNGVSSILHFSYPDSVLHWGWNMGRFPDLVSNNGSGGCLQDLKNVGLRIKKKPHSYDLWCTRQKLAKELGIDAKSELKFTEKFLFMNKSRDYAWAYRKWVLEEFGGWENELKFCDVCLKSDILDGYAWDQRLFVVTKFERDAMEYEVDYAKKCICENPENEHCWFYLKSLCKELRARVDAREFDEALDGLFMSLFDAEAHFLKQIDESVRKREIVDLELNIVKGERRLILALDGLLHLVRLGYLPRYDVLVAVRRMNPSSRIKEFWGCVDLILTFAWPQRAPYWRTLMREALLRYEKHDWLLRNS